MRPTYSITIDDKALAENLKDRIVNLTITDEVGFVSDMLQVKFSDYDNKLKIPKVEVKIKVSIGFNPLVEMGTFVVDDVKLGEGFISVGAKGFDTRNDLKSKGSKNFKTTNVSEVVEKIAIENGLEAFISDEYKNVSTDKNIIQQNESALHLLRRLAKSFDAVFKIQGTRLMFVGKNSGRTVSGKPNTVIMIDKKSVTSWSMRMSGRAIYKKVIAKYIDVDSGLIHDVTVGDKPPVMRIKTPFNDKSKAFSEAKTILNGSGFEDRSLTLTVPGNVLLRAETIIEVSGFKKEVDGRWVVLKAAHTLDSGYTTKIECQKSKV